MTIQLASLFEIEQREQGVQEGFGDAFGIRLHLLFSSTIAFSASRMR